MNALRIDEPIPQLPELTPLIGRTVEIIVLDDSELGEPGETPDLDAPVRFDELLGGWPEDQRADAFDQKLIRHWNVTPNKP